MASPINVILAQIHKTKSARLEYGGLCLENEDIGKICRALKNHPQLETLELWTNNLTAEGVKEVTDLILSNPQLKKIDLSNNRIDSFGALTIMTAVRRANEARANQTKQSYQEIEVDLSDNPTFTLNDNHLSMLRPR